MESTSSSALSFATRSNGDKPQVGGSRFDWHADDGTDPDVRLTRRTWQATSRLLFHKGAGTSQSSYGGKEEERKGARDGSSVVTSSTECRNKKALSEQALFALESVGWVDRRERALDT